MTIQANLGGAPATSPSLAATIARVDELTHFDVHLGPPASGEWVGSDQLLVSATDRLPDLVARARDWWDTEDLRIAASLLVYTYAQRLAVVALAAFALERRVPDVSAGNVAIELPADRPIGGIALREPRFACLGDEAQAAEGVFNLADDEQLLAWLQERLLGAHLERFVQALRREVPVSPTILWGNVAACCAGAFVRVLQFRGSPPATFEQDARACFDTLITPLDRRAGYARLQHEDREWLMFRRGTCCLSYRRAGSPYCADCVHLDEATIEAAWRKKVSPPAPP